MYTKIDVSMFMYVYSVLKLMYLCSPTCLHRTKIDLKVSYMFTYSTKTDFAKSCHDKTCHDTSCLDMTCHSVTCHDKTGHDMTGHVLT